MSERPAWDLSSLKDGIAATRRGLTVGARGAARITRDHPYLVTLGLTTAVCIPLMAFVDAPLAQNLKIHLSPETTRFFSNDIGALGKPEAYLAIAALVIIFTIVRGYFDTTAVLRERLKRFRDAAIFFIASILLAGVVVNVLKPIIGRVRPRALFQDGFYGFDMFSANWGMNSFPSGHTQMAFSLAVALCLIYPRYDVIYLAFAVAIGASRVFGTVHFLSDTVMGAYIGIAVPLLLKQYFYDPRGINIRVYFDRDKALPQPNRPAPEAEPDTIGGRRLDAPPPDPAPLDLPEDARKH